MKAMHQGLNLYTSKEMGTYEKTDIFSKSPSGILKTTQRTVKKDKYSIRVSRLPKPVTKAWQDSALLKDNITQSCGNDLISYRRLPSHVGNLNSDIIPIYETASQIKGGPYCDSPSIQTLDSKYYFRKKSPRMIPRIHSRDRICSRCSKSINMCPAGLKRQGLDQPLPALIKLDPFDISQHIEVHRMPDCSYRNIPLKASLHSENRIKSMNIRSDGKFSSCTSGRLLSTRIALNNSNQRIDETLRSQKIMGKDESLSFSISLTRSSKFASIIDLFTKVPTLSSPFSKELQFKSPHHKDYNEDFNKNECTKRESFSSFPISSTSNSPLKKENEPSKEFIDPGSKFYTLSNVNSPVSRSLKSFLCSTAMGAQTNYRNSDELMLNEANVKPIVDKGARCASGVWDSLDRLYRFPDSPFESSLDSSKSLSSKRASHTTIDQIEMELDAKTDDIKSQMFYGRPINRTPSLAVSSYSVPATFGTVRNLEYKRHIDTKYINNRNSTPNNHNPSEENRFLEGFLVSETLSNHTISQSASQGRLKSNKFTSRKGFPVLTTQLNSSTEKKVQHGLSTRYPECTSLGDVLINHGNTYRDSRYNLSPKPAFIHLQGDQCCSEPDPEPRVRKKEDTGLNKTKLSPTYDQNSTLMLNFSHLFSPSPIPLSHPSFIAPKPISPTRLIFESSVPQLMKALPPPPPGYISTEVNRFSRNKDSEISHISSPERVKSEKNSIRPGIFEKNRPKIFLSTNKELMKRVELKNNKVYAQEAQGNNQYNRMKRSSARLNFSMKSSPTLTNCSSGSVTTFQLAPWDKDCVKAVEPVSITVLKEPKGLKSQIQDLKTPNVQSSCHETFSIKKEMVSFKSITRLLNSRPKVFPISRTKFESNFGYFSDDLRSIQEISANIDLNMGENLFNLETIKRKNSEQSSNPPSLRGKNFESNIVRNVDLTSVNSNNDIRVEGHRILKKLSRLISRIASSLVVTRRKSDDERLWGTRCSSGPRKMHTARSVANPSRKHNISSPILSLRQKLQSQRLEKKFRGCIHSARSSIAVPEKSRAKLWRRYKTCPREDKDDR